jgi:predicted MFS family arabinose efflux permease
VAACWDVFQFVMPLYGASIGMSASAIGSVLAMFALGSLLIRLVMPMILTRVSTSRLVMFALLLSIVTYAAIPFAGGVAVLLVLATLLGVAPGIAQPLLLASLHTVSPPGRVGETAGLRMTMVSAMQLMMPVGLGSIAGLLGFAPLFWVYAVVASALTAGLWRSRRDR